MKEYTTIFQTLRGYCNEYQPNDKEYLEENPETVEEIAEINNIQLDSEKEVLKGLNLAISFLDEWFPDEVDEEEQEEIQEAINQGNKAIKELEK